LESAEEKFISEKNQYIVFFDFFLVIYFWQSCVLMGEGRSQVILNKKEQIERQKAEKRKNTI